MPDFFDQIAELSSTYAAEDFAAQRKRLREARTRWIDENECPKPHIVESVDSSGKKTSFSSGFEVGKRTYDGDWHEGLKDISFNPAPEADPDTLKELDANIAEVETFLAPNIYVESPHPELREGEDHGAYVERVARAYERQLGDTCPRRPVASDDGIRESAPTGAPDERRILSAGGAPGTDGRAAVDRDAYALRASDSQGKPEPGIVNPDSAGGSSSAGTGTG